MEVEPSQLLILIGLLSTILVGKLTEMNELFFEGLLFCKPVGFRSYANTPGKAWGFEVPAELRVCGEDVEVS